jgi:demethylmenaquinone methyltransferase/2-methoxy-6-polyprenyl-1,4-benzoquinol methylase
MHKTDTPQKTDTPAMFTEIARRYDLLNHLLSLNIDRRWRRELIRSSGLSAESSNGARILDACTGTADVAIGFAKALPGCTVVGVDLSDGMLNIGREKVVQGHLADRIELYEGDVLELPFADGGFDVVSIAFGLRNLPDYAKGVSEMTRVLKPGGKLMILEFSPPSRGLYLKGYNFYLHHVLPVIGGLVSGSWKAYRYLASSIGDFLPKEQILELMREADLTNVSATRMAGGITYLFRGERRPLRS